VKTVTATTTIDRPRQELFDLIVDLRNHEAWTDHMLVDWSGDAERVRVRGNVPGPKDWLDVQTTEVVAPEKTVERTVGAKGKRVSYGTYRLTERAPDRTDVEFELRFEKLPARERVTWPLVNAFLKRQNAKAMARLKEHAERA